MKHGLLFITDSQKTLAGRRPLANEKEKKNESDDKMFDVILTTTIHQHV